MKPETIPASFEKLRSMLADLDGYIDRRAQELAVPLIEEARREFDQGRAEIERHLGETAALNQRNEDLLKELRRRLDALTQREGAVLLARDHLAAALGHHRSLRSLPSLVDEAIEVMCMSEAVAALTGKDAADAT